MRMPRYPYVIEISGQRMLKKVNGAYATVATPSVPAMYAPQLFHGISADPTVAESPMTRDWTTGARFIKRTTVSKVVVSHFMKLSLSIE